MKISYSLVLFLLAISPKAKPVTMEVYGDSVSTGFLAYTNTLSSEKNPGLASRILSDLIQYALTQDKEKYFYPHHRPNMAWPVIYATESGNISALKNFSATGAKTHALQEQVKSLMATATNSISFFFIGHNDLCRNDQSPEQIAMFFVDEVRKAVEIWNGVHSQSTLYFLPVGRIHDAYELQKDVIWYEGSRPLGCFDSWERYFPYCRDYVRLLKKGKLSAYLKPRIDAMNNGLRTLAREWERKQLSNHFAYLDGVENSPYEREFFALDCFHLSEAGQNTLAHSIMDAVNFNQNLFLNRL